MPTPIANIATIIAAENIGDADISAACDRLRDVDMQIAAHGWIDEGKAADIEFSGDLDAARAALAPMQDIADICVQGGAARRKMLLVSDMDSTMITVECIDELADYAGIKPQIAEVTERAMRGELDFAEALRARVALLAGLEESAIARCLDERVRPMAGAETLVQTMAAWGAHTILVSGGFVQFADQVARQIGIKMARANILGISDGKLTGEVEGDIVDASAKQALLVSQRAAENIDPAAVLSVGDGANDIPMLQAAIEGGGLGVAYHAKPKAAEASNFAVQHNDLKALLYAQGVPQSDWAA